MRTRHLPLLTLVLLWLQPTAPAWADDAGRIEDHHRIAAQVIHNCINMDPTSLVPSEQTIRRWMGMVFAAAGEQLDTFIEDAIVLNVGEKRLRFRVQFLTPNLARRYDRQRLKQGRGGLAFVQWDEDTAAAILVEHVRMADGPRTNVEFRLRKQLVYITLTVSLEGHLAPDVAARQARARWRMYHDEAVRLGLFARDEVELIMLDPNHRHTQRPLGQLRQLSPEVVIDVCLKRRGVIADGTSRVMLVMPVDQPGTATFSLTHDGDGKIEPFFKDLGGRSQEIDERHFVFALYQPPAEFGRGPPGHPLRIEGSSVAYRPVEVHITFQPTPESGPRPEALDLTGRIQLAKPPIVLVHGTFDNPANCWETPWEHFPTLPQRLQRAGYAVWVVDYQRTNNVRLRENANVVWDAGVTEGGPTPRGGIRQALEAFTDPNGLNLAAARVHVVGHSLGGLLARMWVSESHVYASVKDRPYFRDDNYQAGDIHRLITVGTPHFGSDLPRVLKALLDIERDKLDFGAWITQHKIRLGTEWKLGISRGAATDQMPGSDALKAIGPSRVPVHAIALVALPDDMHAFDGAYRQFFLSILRQFDSDPRHQLYRETFANLQQQADIDRLLTYMRDIEWRGIASLEEPNSWIVGDRDRSREEMVLLFFRAAMFGNVANDFVVRVDSQRGGLVQKHYSTMCGVQHSKAPRYPHVQNRIIELLDGRHEAFHADGLPEAGQTLTTREPGLTILDSDARLRPTTKQEAIRLSNIHPPHAQAMLEVADRHNVLILVRPVNEDATALIARGYATKGMHIKGKSSDWGVHRGFIAIDQRFSKLARKRSDYPSDEAHQADMKKFTEKAESCITDRFARPVALTLEGQPVRGWYDDANRVPRVMVRLADGNYREQLPDGTIRIVSKDDPVVNRLEPLQVLANEDGKELTADYDLLAIGWPGEHKLTMKRWDDMMGYIRAEEKQLIREINQRCNHPGGDVVHHGPETSFPLSPGIDYPITAFEPGGVVVHLHRGPDLDPDRHVRDYYQRKRAEGYQLEDNEIWNWRNQMNCEDANQYKQQVRR